MFVSKKWLTTPENAHLQELWIHFSQRFLSDVGKTKIPFMWQFTSDCTAEHEVYRVRTSTCLSFLSPQVGHMTSWRHIQPMAVRFGDVSR